MSIKKSGRSAILILLAASLAPLPVWQCAGRCAQKDLSPVDTFRASLADPASHDLRKGMDIDNEVFKTAIEDFGRENSGMLRKLFEESIGALPDGQLPEPSEYTKVMALDADEGGQGVLEGLKLQWVLFPDIDKVVLSGINYIFPGAAISQKSMTPAQIGAWLFFLHAAMPQKKLCGREEDQIIVCADYGGQDVFVVKLQPLEYAWVLDTVTWWHRGAAPGGEETSGAPQQTQQPPEAAGEFKVPPTVKDEDGWETYQDSIVLNAENAKDLLPGQASPEAAVAHFYASWIRKDTSYLDVLPPKEQWTSKIAGAIEEMSKWTFIEVRIMGRQEESPGVFWIKVYMEITYKGKPDSGIDEATVQKIGDKWYVIEPPT
jgi:hypothetical protein